MDGACVAHHRHTSNPLNEKSISQQLKLKSHWGNATEKSIAQKRSKGGWGKRPRNGDEPHPNLNEKSISQKQVRKRQSCGCPDLAKFPT